MNTEALPAPVQTTFFSNSPSDFNVDAPKILLVAERSTAHALAELLQPMGYEVASISAVDSVMDYYRDFEPDVLLLDVALPRVHLFDVCRELRSTYGTTAAAVIFIASRAETVEIAEALAAGGVDFLSRPFIGPEVVARIQVHLLNRLRLTQARRDDAAKNRLLCTAAHDLRNPLVSIRALTNLLRTGSAGSVSSEQRDLLDTIYDASHSMLDLVNALFDVSVHQAGELRITPRRASLAAVVESAAKLNNAMAEEKASAILFDPGELPATLVFDEAKIYQVLNNLLGNAIKFSPPGSIITVTTACDNHACYVRVRDQGPGIRETERMRLFKDFSRTSARPTGGESSTGLGLAICYKIMQAHAGSIDAENLPEGGAEFCITLPVVP